MARPLRILFADAYYHVTWRGNERKGLRVPVACRFYFGPARYPANS